MREFLEDALSHSDDGLGRAQKPARADLPKRFYKATGVGVVDGGFTVTLDGRATRTPGRVPVVVPVAGIATIMAEQWAAQGDVIDAETMPMVRLVNAALESGADAAPPFRAEIVKYAGSDLLLYRADTARELVVLQEELWDGVLVKLARHFGVRFQPTIGILHQEQPAATLAKLDEVLQEENVLVLTAMVSITGLTGSGLLAIALRHGLIDADAAWKAAHVDEDYQIGLWGEVDEATERRAKRRIEFDAAVELLELMGG
jgi:chaperone required for assembly of F1-ATPase